MFTYINDFIFPFVFEFVSKLVGFASCPLYQFQLALQFGNGIPYTDLITGEELTLTLFTRYIDGTLINGFIELITFGVPDIVPLWVALLLACINGFIIVSIVKFVLDIIF